MNESEELQAILSEPGKAVGKYFDTRKGFPAYVGADARMWPYRISGNDAPLMGAVNEEIVVPCEWGGAGDTDAWERDLIRVRKADPDRNLNLKVGMRVRLVNGDVERVTVQPFDDSVGIGSDVNYPERHRARSGMYEGYEDDPYHPLHICEVIEEAENAGGLLDSVKERLDELDRRLLGVERSVDQHEALLRPIG